MNKKLVFGGCAAVGVAVIALVTVLVLRGRGNDLEARQITVFDSLGAINLNRGNDTLGVSKDMRLKNGDDILVGEDSFIRMCLDDDKFVFADSNTNFSIEASGSAQNSKSVVNLISGGDLICEVRNKLEGDSSFIIQTPNTTMAIRGTVTGVNVEEAGVDENGNTIYNCTAVVVQGSAAIGVCTGDGYTFGIAEAGTGISITAVAAPESVKENIDLSVAFSNDLPDMEEFSSQLSEMGVEASDDVDLESFGEFIDKIGIVAGEEALSPKLTEAKSNVEQAVLQHKSENDPDTDEKNSGNTDDVSEEPAAEITEEPAAEPTEEPTVIPSDDEISTEDTDTAGQVRPDPDPPVYVPEPVAPPDPIVTDPAPAEPEDQEVSPEPTEEAVEEPTAEPTEEPTAEPTEEPTAEPTEEPTAEPTEEPTAEPTEEPTAAPTEVPTEPPVYDPDPVYVPTAVPSPTATPEPTPTEEPSPTPTEDPSPTPTEEPSPTPAEEPSPTPTENPTPEPTSSPTPAPVEDISFTVHFSIDDTPFEAGTDVDSDVFDDYLNSAFSALGISVYTSNNEYCFDASVKSDNTGSVSLPSIGVFTVNGIRYVHTGWQVGSSAFIDHIDKSILDSYGTDSNPVTVSLTFTARKAPVFINITGTGVDKSFEVVSDQSDSVYLSDNCTLKDENGVTDSGKNILQRIAELSGINDLLFVTVKKDNGAEERTQDYELNVGHSYVISFSESDSASSGQAFTIKSVNFGPFGGSSAECIIGVNIMAAPISNSEFWATLYVYLEGEANAIKAADIYFNKTSRFVFPEAGSGINTNKLDLSMLYHYYYIKIESEGSKITGFSVRY